MLREVDYEISNGRYTLIITATDQCPIPQLRLTSSATVSDNLPAISVIMKYEYIDIYSVSGML